MVGDGGGEVHLEALESIVGEEESALAGDAVVAELLAEEIDNGVVGVDEIVYPALDGGVVLRDGEADGGGRVGVEELESDAGDAVGDAVRAAGNGEGAGSGTELNFCVLGGLEIGESGGGAPAEGNDDVSFTVEAAGLGANDEPVRSGVGAVVDDGGGDSGFGVVDGIAQLAQGEVVDVDDGGISAAHGDGDGAGADFGLVDVGVALRFKLMGLREGLHGEGVRPGHGLGRGGGRDEIGVAGGGAKELEAEWAGERGGAGAEVYEARLDLRPGQGFLAEGFLLGFQAADRGARELVELVEYGVGVEARDQAPDGSGAAHQRSPCE